MKFFNRATFENIPQKIKIAPAGFRIGFLSDVFQEDLYHKLLTAYPPFSLFTHVEDEFKNVFEGPYFDAKEHRGCKDHLSHLPSVWHELLLEANSQEFTSLFSNAASVPFNGVRNFSFKWGKEGNHIKPHLDQAAKSKNSARSRIVCMFYFGEQKGKNPGGTCIYAKDRETPILEADMLYNSMLFFEQHPDAWHGYKSLVGSEERKAMAITFFSDSHPPKIKTSMVHRLFCPAWIRSRFNKGQKSAPSATMTA